MKIEFGGHTFDNPDAVAIEKMLRITADNDGILVMRPTQCKDIGPQRLSFYAEKGRFLVMLDELAEDGDTNVRTLAVGDQPWGLEMFFGESYPAKAVVYDIQLVYAVFKEFACTGNVSKDRMH